MKKLLSIILALTMVFNPIAVFAESAVAVLNSNDEEIVILDGSTERKVVISSDTAMSELSLYVAAYKDKKLVETVMVKDVSLSVGETTVDVEPTWTSSERDYVKVFLWDENMSPVAQHKTIYPPTIRVETVYADAADGTVEVDVSIENNPGLMSLMMYIDYDESLVLNTVIYSEQSEFGYTTVPEPFGNHQLISWINPLEETKLNGTIATLVFDVSGVSASQNEAVISVTCDRDNTFNSNDDKVDFDVVNGKIVFDTQASLSGSLMSETPLTISVPEKTAVKGETVDVDIMISDNPGVSSLIFEVKYDEYLTLTNVDLNKSLFGSMLVSPTPYKNPQRISMVDMLLNDISSNGRIATLTFLISEDAPDGYQAEINITFDEDDILNSYDECVSTTVVNNIITLYDSLPGDMNMDGRINNWDPILHFQHIAGFDVAIDKDALDTNGDEKVNARDSLLLFKYAAKWPDIILYRGNVCDHVLEAISEKAPSCTEAGNIAYWRCTAGCDNYYSDAKAKNKISIEDTIVASKGHTLEIIPAVAPDYGVEGWTEGEKCSVCGIVTKEPQPVDPLEENEYSITYNYEVDKGYTYFKNQPKNNTNPTKYTSQGESFILTEPYVPGFAFKGWFDADGKRWLQIPKGTTGNLFLFAHFERETYTVKFDTPDVDVYTTWYDEVNATTTNLTNEAKYTVDIGLDLPNPDKDSTGQDLVYGYSFVGWSDDNGFIVKSIKAGETENRRLHANWISDRNKATSYSEYDEPIIIEDSDNHQFIFVYNIGRIDNVPLTEYTDINGAPLFATGGLPLDVTITERKTSRFEESDAKEIAESIANATTKSSGWTLSEDWNEMYGVENGESGKEYKSEERVDSNGKVVGGKYFVSNSASGSTYTSNESGSSSSNSAKITTEDSVGISGSFDLKSKMYVDAELSVENKTEIGAGIKAPIPIGTAEASVKNTTTVGSKVSSGRSDETAFHIDGNMSSYVGTDKHSASSTYDINIEQNSNSWNSNNSYENSHEYCTEESITNAIATEVLNTKKYNFTNSLGGSSVNNVSDLESNSTEKTYSSTVVVANIQEEEVTKEYTFKNDAPGYYRLMRAGTIHVYAVVGYDVATSSYYTYTYNILDDKTYDFMDFSTNGNFNDCENSVVTFEVPYEVNEYVLAMTGKTEGLEVTKGKVTAFKTPEEFNGIVVIPPYCADVPVGDVYSSHQTVELAEGLFMNNTDITTVILPTTVSVIPKDAFKGCTNLKNVIAFGVTEVGEGAFSGCTNLSDFKLDNMVTSIGKDAFLGAGSVKIMAKDSTVAMQAIKSGAKCIVVDFAKITDTVENTTISVTSDTSYLGLQVSGTEGPKEFINVTIDSDATETFISNIVFKNNNDVPLKISSQKLGLAAVKVENTPDLALIMEAENAELSLHNDVVLSSVSDLAVLSKNVNITQLSTTTGSSLTVNGEMLVYGVVTDSMKKLTIVDGKDNTYRTITSDEYLSYLNDTVEINFNTNEGSSVEKQTIKYGRKATKPANPTKTAHAFLGWFTDEACTIAFNFGEPVTKDITLYAGWKLNSFTVTFNPNGGTVSPTTKTVTYGNTYGDLPTPTRTGYTFEGWYSPAGYLVTADNTVGITSDIELTAKWKLNTYKVTWSNVTGVTISVKRTESPYANAQLGSLSSGNTVNYGDVLSVTYSTQTGYTKTSNGKTTLTVTGNITSEHIYATATLNKYTVTFNGNGGTSSKASQTVTYNSTYGTLPTATRDYYTFLGWYTAASGGTKVTTSTKFTSTSNVTLYAHWELKPLSGWTASNVPSGAKVEQERWLYDLRTNTESKETSLSGYTQYGSYWVQYNQGSFYYSEEFPAGFDTTHEIYTSMAKSPYDAYETQTEKREVSTSWSGYVYWHWAYPLGDVCYPDNRLISSKKGTYISGCGYTNNFAAFKDSTNYGQTDSKNNTSNVWYFKNRHNTTDISWWWIRFNYRTCSYKYFYKMFKYYKIEYDKVSETAITATDLITNVRKQVRYREK